MAGENLVVQAGKTGADFFVPTPSKIALYVTLIVFLVFATIGTIESFEQKSVFPLIDNTLFKVFASDHKLGQLVDSLENQARPTFDGIFAKTYPSYFWFWLKFWLEAFSNIYFMIFFGWLIYIIFDGFDNTSMFRNIMLALLIFVVVQFIFGLLLFTINIQTYYDSVTYEKEIYVKVPDKLNYFNDAISHSYPLQGTIKFFHHWISKDLFYKIRDISNTDIGSAISEIPLTNGTILNYTGG